MQLGQRTLGLHNICGAGQINTFFLLSTFHELQQTLSNVRLALQIPTVWVNEVFQMQSKGIKMVENTCEKSILYIYYGDNNGEDDDT